LAETALIGLGSNLGDSAGFLESALVALDAAPGVRVVGRSSLYVTRPVGEIAQPDFLNMAARLETTLSPEVLLDLLLGVERTLDRERVLRWGPRTIDLDLLLQGGHVIAGENLTLPHPELPHRGFVLAPLVEIAPDFHHPVLGVTMRELHRRWVRLNVDAGVQVRRVEAGPPAWRVAQR